MNKAIMKYGNSLEVMSEPMRLNILSLIGSNGKLRGKDLLEMLDLTQPTLSHHMSVLLGANLITARKEGRCVWYSLNKTTLMGIAEGITSICDAKPTTISKATKISAKTTPKNEPKLSPKPVEVVKEEEKPSKEKKDKKKKKKDKDKEKSKKKKK